MKYSYGIKDANYIVCIELYISPSMIMQVKYYGKCKIDTPMNDSDGLDFEKTVRNNNIQRHCDGRPINFTDMLPILQKCELFTIILFCLCKR